MWQARDDCCKQCVRAARAHTLESWTTAHTFPLTSLFTLFLCRYNPLCQKLLVNGRLPSGWDDEDLFNAMRYNLKAAKPDAVSVDVTGEGEEVVSDAEEELEVAHDAFRASAAAVVQTQWDVIKESDMAALLEFEKQHEPFLLAWIHLGPLGLKSAWFVSQPVPSKAVTTPDHGTLTASAIGDGSNSRAGQRVASATRSDALMVEGTERGKAHERLGQAHREAHDIATRQLATLLKQHLSKRTRAKELYELVKGTSDEEAAKAAYIAALKEDEPSFESILDSLILK